MKPGNDPVRIELRLRLFQLLVAIEIDLGEIIREWVLPFDDECTAGSWIIDAAQERQIDDFISPEQALRYITLGETVSLVFRSQELLPPDVAEIVRRHGTMIDGLSEIRNRVTHPERVVDQSDLDVVSALRCVRSRSVGAHAHQESTGRSRANRSFLWEYSRPNTSCSRRIRGWHRLHLLFAQTHEIVTW